MPAVPLRQIASDLALSCKIEALVSGYQIDSRMCAPGDLFFALKGEFQDGHNYLAEVVKRGAVAAVVRKGSSPTEALALLEVEDVAEALRSLAAKGLQRHPSKILGITGSVGKTMTKEFAATLLGGKYVVGKSPASYNSKITFPLNLLNRSGQEELLVLEMGMSESGELERLTQIAAPDAAILTKIALAHAMNFPDGLKGIARAKAEIFSQEKTKAAIVDLDCLVYPEVKEAIRGERITFSIKERAADYYLAFVDGQFRIDERGVRAHQFDLPFKESHLLHDFLAAVAAARWFKMEWDEIERQIAKLALPKMRFELLEVGGITFVNDAYNANPASMCAALENLPLPQEGGKKIAILGSMKELGAFCKQAHREVGYLAQKHADFLLCFGEETKELCEAFGEAKKPYEHFGEKQALTERLLEIVRAGDVVLIKGSRSMQLEAVLEGVHAAFPC